MFFIQFFKEIKKDIKIKKCHSLFLKSWGGTHPINQIKLDSP